MKPFIITTKSHIIGKLDNIFQNMLQKQPNDHAFDLYEKQKCPGMIWRKTGNIYKLRKKPFLKWLGKNESRITKPLKKKSSIIEITRIYFDLTYTKKDKFDKQSQDTMNHIIEYAKQHIVTITYDSNKKKFKGTVSKNKRKATVGKITYFGLYHDYIDTKLTKEGKFTTETMKIFKSELENLKKGRFLSITIQ